MAALCAAVLSIGAAAAPVRVAATMARAAAARLPDRVAVEVTGDPADPELIREAIQQAILRATKSLPGSSISIVPGAAPTLRPGERARLAVRVQVRNPSAAPVSGAVSAAISNTPMELVAPARLLVSNRPETVIANGVLFAASLQPADAVRLLYHHRNGATTKKVLTVTLDNPADSPATVFLTGATAGPSTDVMYAGLAATARFVKRIGAGQGYLLELGARRTHTFSVAEMPPGALVTGLLQVQLLRGERIAVSVHVRSPWLLARTVTSELNQTAVAHPHGAFPMSEVLITRAVRTGERIMLTDLGFAATPDDPATGQRLFGDYGILYRVQLALINPLDRGAVFEIAAQAMSGPARGVLLIGGSAVDFGLLRPGEERVLTAIELAAQESRTVQMLTMPVAGSFYPVRLSVQGVSR